jgi:small subunit ribosomal protein S18
MGRGNDRERRRAPKEAVRRGKKRVCIFCKEHIEWVDYKDVNLLKRYMSDRGKIRARRVSGNCTQHQREVAVAIKTARELALLPYTQRATAERGPGRGRREGGRDGPRDGMSGPRPDDGPRAPLDIPVEPSGEVDVGDDATGVEPEVEADGAGGEAVGVGDGASASVEEVTS